MPVRTNIAKSYLTRLAIIGVFFLGMGGYSYYDGSVAWPKQRERALLYQEYLKDDRYQEWKDEAKKRGWPLENPGEPKTEADFFEQFVMAGITAPIGLCILGFFLTRLGRWIEADDKGLRATGGHDFSYDQITVLNKKKWKKKGIAKLRYQSKGGEKKLTLDDYNYERETTREILRMVENNIDHDKITNGPPEPPLKPTAESSDDAASK